MQVDALKKAGCTKVHTEVMSGSRSDRPILVKTIENLRAGDVLVIWKLDRLGRSLQHLVDLVNDLMARKVGLKSLNDPIDTTTWVLGFDDPVVFFDFEPWIFIFERLDIEPLAIRQFCGHRGRVVRQCAIRVRRHARGGRQCLV
jgi:DNA invertase Pin-like site-specific DNA recombinase